MKISMKSFHFGCLATAMTLILVTGTVFAGAPVAEGDARTAYWSTDDGVIVMTGSGECLRTQWWTPALAVAGCDPVAAPPATTEAEEPQPTPAEAVAPPVLTDRVYFGFDKYDLDATDRQVIDELIAALEPAGIGQVRLAGHADRIGTEDYNFALSLRRATSVSDYLTGQHGIAPQLISLEALGESQPRVYCNDDQGWTALVKCLQPNRRVRIELLQ